MGSIQSAVNDKGQLISDPNLSKVAVLPIVTIFWLAVALVGIFVPCFFWKYKHRLTLQVSIVTTAVCLYTFWLLAFLAQLNPLTGPQLEEDLAHHIRQVWGASKSDSYECQE
ncbi:PREDICTED: V-type proton ATPase subunit e 2-like [Amphimedon queenslandica]|uniref:V-type proton ATPase subunit n=1 Tax=Amphimedon queenslandica TaxID=400682 RepID=A0A1X7VK37_AMPQE|nr:PREDICTED: V-type proton ATPase subunit e 2-like [Amphimedon queenslandica]|eukprot:XP_003383910.1 PREDICTED: V-type proton ATPase subunit e 2-like [Amphimedon queenslandica]